MKGFTFSIIFFFSLTYHSILSQTKITGTVSSGGKGIRDVLITDGKQIVKSDKKGNFSLIVESDRKFVYYTLPAQYDSPTVKGIPVFFEKIKPNTKNQKINFELIKINKDQTHHAFIAWADPQVKELEEFNLMQKVVDDTKKTIETLKDIPVHGIALGDLVFDELHFFDQYKEKINQLQIPFYQVIGNHDMDYNQKSNFNSDFSYTESFGPSYYSFNKGKIHYITLKDVFYYGYSYKYIGYIDDIQLKWLENDLSYVSKGTTIVLSLHIPTVYGDTEKPNFETVLSNSVMNKKELFRLLEPYKTHIISGHSHTQWNTNISENIIEHTHAAVCAAWWQGDICTDGSPQGYTVYEVNGNDVKWYFKGAETDENEQFKTYPIGTDSSIPDYFIANVFNYDDKWSVSWYENDVYQGELVRYWGVDPLAKNRYKTGENKKYSWLNARETHHLFKAKPNNPDAKIKILVVDRFGNQYYKELN